MKPQSSAAFFCKHGHSTVKFEPFLLDRLLTRTDFNAGSDAARRTLSIDQVKATVARDLEALLNTRTALVPEAMKAWKYASQSVLTFGLMDFAGLSLDNPKHRADICASIEGAILRNEPRLRDVAVCFDREASSGAGLRFSISATLVVNPAMEPVSFDALLQPTTQKYAVTQNGRKGRE
jgi:type VI secretion system protein ImpF